MRIWNEKWKCCRNWDFEDLVLYIKLLSRQERGILVKLTGHHLLGLRRKTHCSSFDSLPLTTCPIPSFCPICSQKRCRKPFSPLGCLLAFEVSQGSEESWPLRFTAWTQSSCWSCWKSCVHSLRLRELQLWCYLLAYLFGHLYGWKIHTQCTYWIWWHFISLKNSWFCVLSWRWRCSSSLHVK